MPEAQRPSVVAFDVVGTLFSLDPIAAKLRDAGLPAGALDEWFARFLRDAFALDAAGIYAPFREVASATLEVMLVEKTGEARRETIDGVIRAFQELPAHPEVETAFHTLAQLGVRIVALTNGGAETTNRLLERANLAPLVERTISVDEVRHWKPRREVYLHAARVCGVPPERAALVAAHAWDILGAREAGLLTAWVSRKEKRFHPAMGTPTVVGQDVAEAAAALVRLPAP